MAGVGTGVEARVGAPAEPGADGLVERVAQALEARGWMMATAESCTGGLIAARCTERAGSSLWFDRGFVTYSNEAKAELLGIPMALIAAHGAVSEPVAQAMAEGALQRSQAKVAVSVTGIAGPGGAVPGKPVGTVCLGWALRGGESIGTGARRLQLEGDRAGIRAATVEAALQQVLSLIPLEAPASSEGGPVMGSAS